MDKGKFKTCRRCDEPGDAHALTFTCFKGQPFLAKDRSRQWMVDSIERAREKHQFDLWAYVIMLEHVHLIIRPREHHYSISSILTSLKSSVSKRALTYVEKFAPAFLSRMEDLQPNGKITHRFWQRGGGYDRNLTESRTILSTIDYVHANPVRRSLVSRPIDWEWSSAVETLEPGAGKIRLDLESLQRSLSE
ncbi:MAG: transposase [Planctomycetaceae bacterium]|nr:transposase [Planctomycetaceae bacterium]